MAAASGAYRSRIAALSRRLPLSRAQGRLGTPWPSRVPASSSPGTGRLRYSTSASPLAPLSQILHVSEEVLDAVATNKPVVALESTIYTHGALGDDLFLERIVREQGAVPAVCGILDGVPTVGLSPEEVERMVSEGAKKVSRRDLAYLIGMGRTGTKMHGGTTISGTMILAELAGIRVFGTGGLGGVHRGGHISMDISADLTELGRTRVAIVCAGSKGFLDIPRTLEFLETQGVLVATFADGREGNVDFPAFWARDSGCPSPAVVRDEKQAAAIIVAQEQLGVDSGLVFANPIPTEFAISRDEMDAAISLAVREAAEQGFSGNTNTPYILRRIREITEGRSVPANKALVQANVARAATVAVEVASLLSTGTGAPAKEFHSMPSPLRASSKPSELGPGPPGDHPVDILVAGSLALDLSCDSLGAGDLALHSSNPGVITQSVGGVGHNVALAAHYVSPKGKVRLCSLVGDDIAGATVLTALEASGMDISYIRQLGPEYSAARTAQYVAVNDAAKNLVVAMADMSILTAHTFPTYWSSAVASSKPKWLVVDGNWGPRDLSAWIQTGRENGSRIVFEPVSSPKSQGLFPPRERGDPGLGLFPHHSIDLTTPNQYELESMYKAAEENGYISRSGIPVDDLSAPPFRDAHLSPERARWIVSLLPFVSTIITKLGSEGAVLATLLTPDDPRARDPDQAQFVARARYGDTRYGGVYVRHFPASETVKDVVSVNGVGDTFLGVLVAGLAQGGKIENLVDVAQRAAVLTLRSHESVSDELVGLRGAVRDASLRS